MFQQFTVGNFLSFKKKRTISLEAVKAVKVPDHVLRIDIDDRSYLPSAVIYGANASGKTNLLIAMDFMRGFILHSSTDLTSGEEIRVQPFRLCVSNLKKPSYFEIIFLMDNIQYRYGFELDSKRVNKEWLYRKRERERLLFERDEENINICAGFREGKGLEKKTRENALFLSVVAQFNGPIAQLVFKWFREEYYVLSAILPRHSEGITAKMVLKDKKHSEKIISITRKFDLGIENISVKKESRMIDDMPDYIKPIMREANQKTIDVYDVETLHNVYDDNMKIVDKVKFDMDVEESDGTARLFRLIGPIVETLDSGSTLVIDEFDNRLHPMILNSLVRLFNSKDTNKKGAQLIFATHNVKLLEFNLFRKDQIWFTEKMNDGSTDLFSLADYRLPDGKRVRHDMKHGEGYIAGRYGAIPYIEDVEDVFS